MIKIILFLLTFIFAFCVATVERPIHTSWTLHTSKKDWNEAELLCELRGGHLANLNTSHRNQMFEELLGKEPWSSSVDYGATVGVHNVANQADDPRHWLPACDENSVPYTYTNPLWGGSGGCASKGTSKIWKINCAYENEFVCEQLWGDVCPYEEAQGRKPLSSFFFTSLYAISDQQCLDSCDQRGVDCWAAAWNDVNKTCLMYNSTSPFTFDDILGTTTANSDYSTFIKKCYESLTDHQNYGWLQAKSSTVLSVCGTDHQGKVYTLVKEAKTWYEAHTHCSNIGQTLAGSDTETDRDTLYHIIQDFYEANYNISGRDPHWVNYQWWNGTGQTKWMDNNTQVAAMVQVKGSNPIQCGSLHIDSATYTVYDCSDHRSFLCVKTDVPCALFVKESSKGTNCQEMGEQSLANCLLECQSGHMGQPCTAFSYRPRSWGITESCQLCVSTSVGFFHPSSFDAKYDLYKFSCVWAILQEETLINDTTTTSTEASTTPTETTTTQAETTTTTTTAVTTTKTAATTHTTTDTLPTTEGQTTTGNEATTTISQTTQSPETTSNPTTPTPSPTTTTTTTATTATTATTTATTTAQPTTTKSQSSTTAPATTTTTSSTPTSSSTPDQTTTPITTSTSTTSDPSQSTTLGPSSTTTTTTTTTIAAAGTNGNSSITVDATCLCRCAVPSDSHLAPFNDTKGLVDKLMIPVNSTYKNRIKYFSVPDYRPSAIGMGVTAILFITAVMVCILMSDLSKLFSFYQDRELND